MAHFTLPSPLAGEGQGVRGGRGVDECYSVKAFFKSFRSFSVSSSF